MGRRHEVLGSAFAAASLALGTFSAVADAQSIDAGASNVASVTAEVALDTPDAAAADLAPQSSSFFHSFASTGASLRGLFYVAWADQRGALVSYPAQSDIELARVDPSTGRPIASDLHGVALTRGALGYQSSVVMATDGASRLALAWTEPMATGGSALHVMPVDPATAQPLAGPDGDGAVVQTAAAGIAKLALAWSGQNYVVIWTVGDGAGSGTASSPAFAARLDANGVLFPADAAGIALPATVGAPSFVCDPSGVSGCLDITSDANGALSATFVNPASGTVGAPMALPSAMSGADAVAAWDGARFLVAASGGNALFLTPTSVGAAFPACAFATGSLVFDGARYVLDSSGNDVCTFLPNADATRAVQTYAPVLVKMFSPQIQTESVIATASGVTLVTGSNVESGLPALFVARLDDATGVSAPADGKAGIEGVALSTDAPFEAYSALAGDNAGHVWAAWADGRDETIYASDAINETYSFYAGAIDASRGVAVEESRLGADISGSHSAAVASDGATAIVATPTSHGLVLGQLSPAGDVLTTMTMPTPDNSVGEIAIAYGGGEYLVVICESSAILFQLLDATSLAPKLATWQPVAPNGVTFAFDPYSIAASFGGDGFLVAWARGVSGYTTEIDGARLGLDGTSLDPAGVALCQDVQANDVALAAGGGHYFLAWDDEDDDLSTFDVRSMMIGLDGTALTSPTMIAGGVGQQTMPSIANDGDGQAFQVVWQDSRSGNFDIYGTRVQYDGSVRQLGGQAITSSIDDERNPHLAPVAPSQMLLSYERSSRTPRLYTRTLTTGATSGSCRSNTDCASLVCADGFCCDRPCGDSCESCATVPGTCTAVVSATDADSCSGASICNASGTCVAVSGKPCGSAAACESGFCVEGICCDAACDGACQSCSVTPGICTVNPAGSTGSRVSCVPYICNGKSSSCPTDCANDTDCVRPYTCNVLGTCTLPAGSICVDVETSKSANGLLSSCAPFVCAGGECGQSCGSITDCAVGFVCNAAGRCVSPTEPSDSEGCAAEPSGQSSGLGDAAGAVSVFAALGALRRRRRRRRRTESASGAHR